MASLMQCLRCRTHVCYTPLQSIDSIKQQKETDLTWQDTTKLPAIQNCLAAKLAGVTSDIRLPIKHGDGNRPLFYFPYAQASSPAVSYLLPNQNLIL